MVKMINEGLCIWAYRQTKPLVLFVLFVMFIYFVFSVGVISGSSLCGG